MREWVRVSKQILIQFTSQKKLSTKNVSVRQKICLHAPLKLCSITHFWYVWMIKHVTAMKSKVFWDLSLNDWVGVTSWFSEETWDFEMLGSTLQKTECHISEDLNLQYHRGDTLQSYMSLPCYKGPHTVTGTFVVRCLWRNRNREKGNRFINWTWLRLVGLYCSFV